jgi:hypothetical protein
MSQIAPAVGTSPARRLVRPVAHRFARSARLTASSSPRVFSFQGPCAADALATCGRRPFSVSLLEGPPWVRRPGPCWAPSSKLPRAWDGTLARGHEGAATQRKTARGKPNPAVDERTPEAQLTTAAFPARGACPARGKLKPAVVERTPEAQLTTAAFPARGALPARGKLNPAVDERTPEAQLTTAAFPARGKLATVLGRTHRKRSCLTAFPAPRLSDRVAEARVESPAEPTKRVEGVVESDVRRLTGPPDQITRKLQCADPARGKPNPAVDERTAEAQLNICCAPTGNLPQPGSSLPPAGTKRSHDTKLP